MYASCDDLNARIGVSEAAQIYPDIATAEADLESASAEIDAALCMRYRVPVTAAAALPLLRDWCLTLAEERAYARIAGSEFGEKVKLRVERVRKLLDEIRAGTFQLPGNPAESGSGGGGASSLAVDEPVFGRDKMRGF